MSGIAWGVSIPLCEARQARRRRAHSRGLAALVAVRSQDQAAIWWSFSRYDLRAPRRRGEVWIHLIAAWIPKPPHIRSWAHPGSDGETAACSFDQAPAAAVPPVGGVRVLHVALSARRRSRGRRLRPHGPSRWARPRPRRAVDVARRSTSDVHAQWFSAGVEACLIPLASSRF